MPDKELLKNVQSICSCHKNLKICSSKRKIIKKLDNNFRCILSSFKYIDSEAKNGKEIVPAAEWLMDNIYLIEKEYKNIKHNMPEDYYKKLPVIKEGEYRGYTRIYHIAWEITHENKGKIDENEIMNFINEYQKSLTLTSNELWALPFMLRIAIIQDISRLSSSIANIQSEREKANTISKKIIHSYNENKLNEEFTKLKAKDIKFTASFAGRLLKSLRDNGVESNEIYKWIDDRLSVADLDSKRATIVEQRKESSLKKEMGNCINSIREVEALNWRYCFENLSVVEKILKNDPAKVYENMDFASRDYYRVNIEKIAIKSNLPESHIARTAIECAVHGKNDGKGEFESHVGYYIVDNGVQSLRDKLKLNKNTAADSLKKHKEFWYLFGNFVGTALLIAAMILTSIRDDKNIVLWKYIVSALIIAVPCSEIVNSILNWSINHLTEAAFIPKMDFSKGIPSNCKTIAVIPAILNDENKIKELAAKLERYYLSNSSENIYFAILGDFKDFKTETEDVNDTKINNAGISAVKKLNEKYSKNYGDIFYFFNRRRVYNPKEKKWIGWERKRGKLMEFNHLLRGDGDTNYNIISSSVENLKNVKYIITLDADTQLPLETAEKLVGSMEHPLNKPYVENGKLVRGYGIMQPRVSISVLSANKTIYSKIFSGETGIDTYSTAVSDVYQDLFGRGIYTGKGIYNIDAFDSTLKGKINENSVLSHDLIEGEYAGCALVTDVELIDGYPAHYDSSSMRIHRWVRGDWQLLPYIFKNRGLKSLSKWKMIDNLRRSLLAPSVILLIIISLTIVPDGFEKWLSLAFVSLVFPWLFDVTEVTSSPIRGFNISGEINSNKNAIEQIFFIFSFICFNAYLMLDAIIRTIYRLTINKNHMLQWRTSEEVEAESGKSLWDYVKLMWVGSVIAAIIGVLSFNRGITLGFIMLPSCLLWFISPVLAFFISKDRKIPSMALSLQDRNMVRRISRKTFAYFEDFVNDYENWLAPDNFQESPPKGVAHRTSPTNMGMGLTSNIAAYDLGYISIYEMISRIEKSMDSMETLEKYKGHFLNWYDTTSKVPLEPKYVSTVDSGNLVGYLWLCEQSLEEYINSPLINIEYKNGLCDVLMLANDEIQNVLAVRDYYSSEITKVQASKLTAVDFETVLTEIKTKCENISNSPKVSELYWNSKALHQIKSRIEEINKIFPWIHLVEKRSEMLLDKAEKIKKMSNEVILKNIPNKIENIINTMKVSGDAIGTDKKWVNNIIDFLNQGKNEIVNLIARIVKLQGRLHYMAENTDFKILYDKNRNLFAIGYNLSEDKISNCFYDLLASESRQASFIAIAKGDASRLHWFKLGSSMTNIGCGKGLVSCSGTMFVYFLPLLI
ncbi:MAG: cyclic beta 1-2 glucan synthetase, partial [Clostridium sp.]|nr:cyclic beta 1-2 glucan synthetase [Clostridium sp.]